ncbi:MAG: zinc ribbon domain-containing protein [Nitrososphaerota archaeon]
MQIRKIVKIKIDSDEYLWNILNAWNIAKYRYRRNIEFDLPSTLKASMKLFNKFNVSHLTFCETGFNIDFDNNEIKLTSLEKYKRISLKIDNDSMKYLKKEIENGAKATTIMVLPPSYKKGHHKRREIVRNSHWILHVTLKKDVRLLTKEEFKKFQRIAIIGADLNSKHGVGYAIWTWNRSNGSIKEEEIGFVKPKIKPHIFQEKNLEKLQRIHRDSVKYNIRFQRINLKIHRQNKDWIEKVSKNLIDIALKSIEKYNCEIAIISFEDLKDYEVNKNNNNNKINKANNQWLRKIIQRTFEKSIWDHSTKVLTYLPTYNKNQINLEQILVDAYNTSRICSKCGNRIEFISNNEIYCKYCNKHKNRHLNSAGNIVRKTILNLCYIIDALPEHVVLEDLLEAKASYHRKSSIPYDNLGEKVYPSMINEGKAFELGEWNKGLNAACLPMGGIGSLYSNPSLEYRQPPEREAKL